jgi:hypothetical protein
MQIGADVAQGVALALGARPGETVLDGCAGRGGKSSVLTTEVVEAFVCESSRSGTSSPVTLKLCPVDAAPLPGIDAQASSLRLLPKLHGTDGHLTASFVVRRG